MPNVINPNNICNNKNYVGRTQAVSLRLPTAAARVRTQVRSCGICCGQSGTGEGFLRVLQFTLPICIQPTAPQSPSSIIWGWYNRPVVAAVPSGLRGWYNRPVVAAVPSGLRGWYNRPVVVAVPSGLRGWYNRPVVVAVPRGLSFTPLRIII
jgi:hypothetical protein